MVIGCLSCFSSISVLSVCSALLQLRDSMGGASSYINVANMLAISIAGLSLGGVLYRYQGFLIGFYAPLICALLLSLLFLTKNAIALYLITFFISLVTGLDNPNNNSVLNSFIQKKEEKARLFSLYTTGAQFSVIISPLIISLLIVNLGYNFAIATIIISYLLNAFLWFAVPFLKTASFNLHKNTQQKKSYWHGSQLLWHILALRHLTLNRILNNFLYTGILLLFPIMLAYNTQDNISFALIQNFILTLIGTGFVLNGAFSSYLLKKRPQLVIYFVHGATLLAFTGAFIALVCHFHTYALYSTAFLLGFGQFYFRVSGMTLGQAITPTEHLGEVILTGDAIVRGVTVLYSLLLLPFVNIFGPIGPSIIFMVLGAFAPLYARKAMNTYLQTLGSTK